MSGEDLNLENNSEILAIKSPKNSVGGPHAVVYKNVVERWAIVAMDWENKPRLGMRWFWGNGGSPFSSGYPIWLVIPPSLSKGILACLPLEHKFSAKIDRFLSGDLNGNALSDMSKA